MKKTSILLSGILFVSFLVSGQNTSRLVKQNFAPETIVKKGDGHYFIDFGKAYFGTLAISSTTGQDTSFTIHLGEKLSAPNQIDQKPPGHVRYQKITLNELTTGQDMMLPLKADRRNSNPPAILMPDSVGVIMPFRYCELENLSVPFEDLSIQQVAYHYPFHDDASYFTSSDTQLNQVWELCKHTIKATSFTGYYIDGDRERIPYEADAYINQLSHYAVDNQYSLARRTNAYFIDHPTWPTEWQLHVALMFYADFLYTGNPDPIRKYYEQLKHKSLIALLDENNLITVRSENHNGKLMQQLGFSDTTKRLNDIVDWPRKGGFGGVPGEADGFDFKKYNTVINALFYRNMEIMTEFARILGKLEDEKKFGEQATKTRQAINSLLWDAEKACYVDGRGSSHASLHANMFPLALGVVPDERKASVARFIKSRGMACSVYGAQYLLEALYEAGESDFAVKLMTATHDRGWYNMIKNGSTMTWEAWDTRYKPNLDWNHAWGTAPANIITRYLWGVTPATPGFQNMVIKPQLENFSHSEIKVPTPLGCMEASYKKTGSKKEVYQFTIPEQSQAWFFLPENINQIKLNGKSLAHFDELVTLSPGINKVIIKLN